MRRTKKRPIPMSIKIIFIAISVMLLNISALIYQEERKTTDGIYLILEGYKGVIYAFYNVKDAPKIERENGYNIHQINDQGYFVTSTPDMNYGTVTDQYFYVNDQGNRTEIAEECVQSYGTLGYSTTVHDEKIDLIYTAFYIPNEASRCNDEWIELDEEEENKMIQTVLKEYYGIQP